MAALFSNKQQLMPAYRVRLYMIPSGAEPVLTGATDGNGQPVLAPFTQPLPDGYVLPGASLELQPDDSMMTEPTQARVLYISALPLTEDRANPPAEQLAALMPAVIDEEDSRAALQIAPVHDGIYTAVVPAVQDASSSPENAGKDGTESEEAEDSPETGEHVYEYAFSRGNAENRMYYVFDTDDMIVRRFLTNDNRMMVGTFTGNAESGFLISWTQDWKETFRVTDHQKAVLIDKNGAEWEYKAASVDDAEAVLSQDGYHDIAL